MSSPARPRKLDGRFFSVAARFWAALEFDSCFARFVCPCPFARRGFLYCPLPDFATKGAVSRSSPGPIGFSTRGNASRNIETGRSRENGISTTPCCWQMSLHVEVVPIDGNEGFSPGYGFGRNYACPPPYSTFGIELRNFPPGSPRLRGRAVTLAASCPVSTFFRIDPRG